MFTTLLKRFRARSLRAPTRRQWLLQHDNAVRLRGLLSDPVMVAALNLLADEHLPEAVCTTPEQMSHRYAYLTGYHRFRRDLEELADATPPLPLPDEWAHIS